MTRPGEYADEPTKAGEASDQRQRCVADDPWRLKRSVAVDTIERSKARMPAVGTVDADGLLQYGEGKTLEGNFMNHATEVARFHASQRISQREACECPHRASDDRSNAIRTVMKLAPGTAHKTRGVSTGG
jgi:hypothetical protein